ncbi:MAG: septum formation initiator family protein [Alistipes sp.]|nr:septum formation initiator family protein [Alistipes sp.]
MDARYVKRFWIGATLFIVAFTLFIVGRNVVHAIRIQRQINALTRQKEALRVRIDADSTLLEQLRYDEYLEEFAREHFRMRRSDDYVYIVEE